MNLTDGLIFFPGEDSCEIILGLEELSKNDTVCDRQFRYGKCLQRIIEDVQFEVSLTVNEDL